MNRLSNSREKDLIEGKMLWTSVLFADKVHYASPLNGFMTIEFIRDLPESNRVDLIKTFVKNWNIETLTPEGVDNIYTNILKFRKMKMKTRNEMLLLMRGTSLLKNLEKSVIESATNGLKIINIFELKNFINPNDDKNVIIGWQLVDYSASGNQTTYIESIYTTLLNSYELPIFSDDIETVLSRKEYSSYELFCIPSPLTLKESQVKIIRKDFKEKFSKLFVKLEEVKENIAKVPFTKDKAKEEINGDTALRSLIKASGRMAEKNIYIEQLKNSNPEETFILNLGVTTFGNLIRVYNKTGVLKDEQVLYVRERIEKDYDLNNMTTFLFLKVKKEGKETTS